jgi:SAM-dependent methyltransferase
MFADDHLARSDLEWERWGRLDPYFGVITHERFRRSQLDDEAREIFFASGDRHVTELLARCQHFFGPAPARLSVLDFGCGVGRLLVPFSRVASRVVGVDVAPTMLAEARRNCDERQASSVELVLSDDRLSRIEGVFDLVHSFIVLQHINPRRGLLIIDALLRHVRDGGLAVLQITYGKAYHPDTFGQPPTPAESARPAVQTAGEQRKWRWWPGRERSTSEPPSPVAPASDADPEMMMHAYNLSEVFYLLHKRGVRDFHADFTDHGGELGATLYVRCDNSRGT